MKKKFLLGLTTVLLLVAMVGVASATLIYTETDGVTGNKYEFYLETNGINWDVANSTATSLGGMLAVLDSPTENAFVANVIDSNALVALYNSNGIGPWLGGFHEDTSTGWQWVDGSPWSYAPWQSGQPDLAEGDLQGLLYYNGGPTAGANWGDYGQLSGIGGGAGSILGYVVEYTSDPIPEPATMMLFGIGLLGLAGVSRRKK